MSVPSRGSTCCALVLAALLGGCAQLSSLPRPVSTAGPWDALEDYHWTLTRNESQARTLLRQGRQNLAPGCSDQRLRLAALLTHPAVAGSEPVPADLLDACLEAPVLPAQLQLAELLRLRLDQLDELRSAQARVWTREAVALKRAVEAEQALARERERLERLLVIERDLRARDVE